MLRRECNTTLVLSGQVYRDREQIWGLGWGHIKKQPKMLHKTTTEEENLLKRQNVDGGAS